MRHRYIIIRYDARNHGETLKGMNNQRMDYYQSAKHRAWREKVLRRDKYLCQECLRYGKKTPATHAHHMKPREDYPELQYVVSNGQSLCAACHNKKHPEKGWRRDG